ncbi:hypothetical protein [Mumia sp. DW29H23]|uniref:hypothetical protein n=1 Tax=Mumia sp. DW29H23 TaxID=3421241 RepID=UPI003D68DC43
MKSRISALITTVSVGVVTVLVAPSAPVDAADDVVPLHVLTPVALPTGLARDAAGTLAAAENAGHAVTFFPPGAVTGTPPSRRIVGAATQLNHPTGVALDADGTTYVVSQEDRLLVFAPGAAGDVAPSHVVPLGKTYGKQLGVAVADDGTVYVSAERAITVLVPDTSGKPVVTRQITGARTRLVRALGITVDGDSLWVANATGRSVLAFDVAAEGDVAPERVIAGATTRLANPAGVVVGPQGRVYVSDSVSLAVAVYPADAAGDVAPVAWLQGANAGFVQPWGIVALEGGAIAVANVTAAGSVKVYATPFPPPPPRPTPVPKAPVVQPPAPKPVVAPGRVTRLKVTGAATHARRVVRWRAPAYDGGARVTGYRIVVKKGKRTLLVRNVGPSRRSFVLRRAALRNGRHVVVVKARNHKHYGRVAVKPFRVRK